MAPTAADLQIVMLALKALGPADARGIAAYLPLYSSIVCEQILAELLAQGRITIGADGKATAR